MNVVDDAPATDYNWASCSSQRFSTLILSVKNKLLTFDR